MLASDTVHNWIFSSAIKCKPCAISKGDRLPIPAEITSAQRRKKIAIPYALLPGSDIIPKAPCTFIVDA